MSTHQSRFSTRVENYIKYRPGYPQEIVKILEVECALNENSVIADVGSGTGILSEIFLRNGYRVIGIEPNEPMRLAAERLLEQYRNFVSVNGSAEATTLEGASVDLITAGQAFHWFDWPKAKTEFQRVLKPGGWVVLIWNERLVDTTPFLRDYEAMLLEYGTDYQDIRHEKAESQIAEFFSPGGFQLEILDNSQRFDLEALRGRLNSSSYVPEPGHPNFAPMQTALERIFSEHQRAGVVSFDYRTKVFYGRLDGDDPRKHTKS